MAAQGLLFQMLKRAAENQDPRIQQLMAHPSLVPHFMSAFELRNYIAVVCRRWWVDLHSLDRLLLLYPLKEGGFPNHQRAHLWKLILLGEQPQIWSDETSFKKCVEERSTDPCWKPLMEELRKDVRRTFGNLPFFNSGEDETHNLTINQRALLNVLLVVISSYRRPLGYGQGMNYLAAVLLYVMKGDQHATAECFYSLLETKQIVDAYDEYFSIPRRLSASLSEKVLPKLPRLKAKLDESNFPLEMFTLPWILLLFSYEVASGDSLLPVLPIWDQFLLLGWPLIFAVAHYTLVEIDSLLNREPLTTLMKSKIKNF